MSNRRNRSGNPSTPQQQPAQPQPTAEKIRTWAVAAWKRISRPVKIPGWLLVAFWIITNIPDWKSRLDFWLSTLQQFRGPIGLIAFALQDSLFGAVILGLGVGYLVFVGEPKQKLQARWWPYVGWVTAGLLALAVCLAIFAGYITSIVSPPARSLTSAQTQTIVREARKLSPRYYYAGGKKAIVLTVMSVDTPEADAYTIQIMSAFLAGNIQVLSAAPGILAPLPMRALTPNIKGVFMQVKNPKNPPILAAKTAQILIDAGIPVIYYNNLQMNETGFILTVGLP